MTLSPATYTSTNTSYTTAFSQCGSLNTLNTPNAFMPFLSPYINGTPPSSAYNPNMSSTTTMTAPGPTPNPQAPQRQPLGNIYCNQQWSPFLFPQNESIPDQFQQISSTFMSNEKLHSGFKPFYISPELTKLMISVCRQRFDGKSKGNVEEASKVLFGYIRQSILMQFNDSQLPLWTVNTMTGYRSNVIIIRPDLCTNHVSGGQELFLVAVENERDLSGKERKTKWKVQYLMTMQQLTQWLKLNEHQLPQSPRRSQSTLRLWQQIGRTPENVPFHMVKSGNLDRLQGSKVKRKTALHRKCKHSGCGCREFHFVSEGAPCGECKHDAECHGGGIMEKPCTTTMSQEDFKMAVMRSWNDYPPCPVVVNRGKRTWIEWKKFVNLGNRRSVAISLKFNAREKVWEILKVIDCDADRVYAQYRLLGEYNGNELISLGCQRKRWEYQELKQLITTRLDIEKKSEH